MNKKHAIILVVILLLTAIACDISFGGSKEPSQDDINLELTRTALQQTQTALAKPPEPEPQAPPPADDSSDDEPEPEADDDDGTACYFSRWTGDETIADGTKFDPGDSFVKSWTLRNEGSCDWSTDTRMVFEEGDKMDAPTSVKIDRVVKPGETYVVEIPMKAPASDGDYTGVWRFTAADGTKMGKYWVKITVGNPTPPTTFKVTSAPLSMADTSINIWCPGNEVVTITANITTSAAGVVTFKWDDSQGCAGCATKSLSFAGAETKSISHQMTVGAAGNYWAKIYIDEPNHQWFGPKNFSVTCN